MQKESCILNLFGLFICMFIYLLSFVYVFVPGCMFEYHVPAGAPTGLKRSLNFLCLELQAARGQI